MGSPVRLQLVIAFHEPLSKDDSALARVWEAGYAPLITSLGQRGVKAAVHLTGHLLDHLARRREDHLLQIKRLVQAQQVEVLGGLFYGGIPSLLPEVDVRGQVQMMTEYWESLLGKAPQGVWLPELAWCAEVPRLLADTGLAYGFVASSQIALKPEPMYSLVVVERGEKSLPAFMLDSELSAALANGELAGWQTRVEALAQMQDQLVTVWISAGLLVDAARSDGGAIDRFFDAFTQIETVLPRDSFAARPRASAVRLAPGLAPELWPAEPRPDFVDFAFRLPAVDTLTRRMLRISGKLYEGISTMEDEELEETWSDALATAQRLVFAAQSPDPFVHGDDAEGEALRAAAMAKLIRAEALIDSLVQGEEDWLATEEEDTDSDLRDEVFVCNRYLTAWIVPAGGGEIRSFDDRVQGLSLIDPRSTSPGRARTLGEHIVEVQCTAGAMLAGQARDLVPALHDWQVEQNGIDEQGDCAYHLQLAAKINLDGERRVLSMRKRVSIPIDAAAALLTYDVKLDEGAPVLLAVEIPVRLPSEPTKFLANGDELDPGALELSDVESLRVETAAGSLEVALEPAFDVWCKLAGDRVLIVPVVRVEREVHCTVRVAFLANPVAAADDAAATGATPADLAALLEQTDGGDDDLAAADAGPVDRRGPGHEDRRGKGRGGPGTN